MFGGPKGCGKTSLARVVARAILCTDLSDGEPCGECDACISVLQETSQDVEELDAASQGTVDKIREMIRDTEYEGSRRIYLIDEAQRLTSQAQDALLKAMEDRLLTVILCTTEPHKIKAPIRSRVEEYPVHPPLPEEILARLHQVCTQESLEADPEALKIVVRMLDSCPRTCIRALSTMSVRGPITIASANEFFRFDDYSAIDRILSLIDQNPRKAFESLDSLVAVQSPSWIRDQMVSAISSAMRFDIGAKPTYPVATRFFQYRLHGWSELVRVLIQLDKPTAFDIEAALLTTGPTFRPTQNREPSSIVAEPLTAAPPAPAPALPALPLPVTPPAKQKDATKPIPQIKSKVLEIDGVKFSSDENLTSLDKKINFGSSTPPVPAVATGNLPSVKSGTDDVPITDKEWARGLIGRIKGPS